LAAELEVAFDETSHLVQSSGGVFEVERDGQLIYSKKANQRFPEDGEVATICRELDQGKPLPEAQNKAAEHVRKPPSFIEWLGSLLNKK
jgi:selT/selW/selH-like putative selenoprotein